MDEGIWELMNEWVNMWIGYVNKMNRENSGWIYGWLRIGLNVVLLLC